MNQESTGIGAHLIRQLFQEFFQDHDLTAADRYLHPDYIQHDFDVPPEQIGNPDLI